MSYPLLIMCALISELPSDISTMDVVKSCYLSTEYSLRGKDMSAELFLYYILSFYFVSLSLSLSCTPFSLYLLLYKSISTAVSFSFTLRRYLSIDALSKEYYGMTVQ